jgi:hypothetical protein
MVFLLGCGGDACHMQLRLDSGKRNDMKVYVRNFDDRMTVSVGLSFPYDLCVTVGVPA